MSISTLDTLISYTGNSSTSTAYAITFKYFSTSHVKVYAAGTDITSTCTFTGDGSSKTGQFTTATAYASTVTIIVTLEMPLDQPTSLTESGPLPAETIEGQIADRTNMQIRSQARDVTRSLKIANGTGTDTKAVANTSNTLLGFGSSGELAVRTAEETVTFLSLPATVVDRPNKVWADDAARALAVPDYIGQDGHQIDTKTDYYGSATTAGSWVLKTRVINVRDYGAKGDGTTDDTAAIQAAMDSVLSRVIRVVYFPQGTYKLSSALLIRHATTKLVGDSSVSTILVQSSSSANGIEYDVAYSNIDRTRIEDMAITGVGGATSTASGLYSRKANGDYFMADVTVSNVRIRGFQNATYVENLPLFRCYGVRAQDCQNGFLLVKCDTFLLHACSVGSGAGSESWCVKITSSTGTPPGGNFGGIIDCGEFGDCSHFILLEAGTVDVRQPNLERITGDYVVRIQPLGRMLWNGGRIQNPAPAGDYSIFSMQADNSSFVPQLTVMGTPLFDISTWRGFEVFGSYNYNASPIWLGAGALNCVYSSTSNSSSLQATLRPSIFLSRRLSSAMSSSVAHRGNIYSYVQNDSTRSLDNLIFIAKDHENSFRRSSLVNDALMRIPAVLSSTVGNTAGATSDLFTATFGAYSLPVDGWTMEIEAFGKFASNGNAKQLLVDLEDSASYILFDTGSVAVNGKDWHLKATVSMTSDLFVLDACVVFTCDDALITEKIKVSDGISRGIAQDNFLKIKGTGVSANDVEIIHAKQKHIKNASEF